MTSQELTFAVCCLEAYMEYFVDVQSSMVFIRITFSYVLHSKDPVLCCVVDVPTSMMNTCGDP